MSHMLPPLKPWANHIYLSGQLGSGKGYCEAILVEHGYVPLAWSDGVYDMVADKNGVSIDHIRNHKTNYRDQLQYVGHTMRTESGNPNYWIDQREREAAKHERTVESGTRYPNECRIGMQKGIVINVQTDFAVRLTRYRNTYGNLPTQAQLDHENEALSAFLPRHHVFDNSSTDAFGFSKSRFKSTVTVASQMEPDFLAIQERFRLINIIAALLTARTERNEEFNREETKYEGYKPLVDGTNEETRKLLSILPPAKLLKHTALNDACRMFIRYGQDAALMTALAQAKRIGFRGKFVSGLVALLKEAALHDRYLRTLNFIG